MRRPSSLPGSTPPISPATGPSPLGRPTQPAAAFASTGSGSGSGSGPIGGARLGRLLRASSFNWAAHQRAGRTVGGSRMLARHDSGIAGDRHDQEEQSDGSDAAIQHICGKGGDQLLAMAIYSHEHTLLAGGLAPHARAPSSTGTATLQNVASGTRPAVLQLHPTPQQYAALQQGVLHGLALVRARSHSGSGPPSARRTSCSPQCSPSARELLLRGGTGGGSGHHPHTPSSLASRFSPSGTMYGSGSGGPAASPAGAGMLHSSGLPVVGAGAGAGGHSGALRAPSGERQTVHMKRAGSRRRSVVVVDPVGRPLQMSDMPRTPGGGQGAGMFPWWDAWEEEQELMCCGVDSGDAAGFGAMCVGPEVVGSGAVGQSPVDGAGSSGGALPHRQHHQQQKQQGGLRASFSSLGTVLLHGGAQGRGSSHVASVGPPHPQQASDWRELAEPPSGHIATATGCAGPSTNTAGSRPAVLLRLSIDGSQS